MFSLATLSLSGCTISAGFKFLPCSKLGVGGGGEDAADV